jgi:hypothetical protein
VLLLAISQLTQNMKRPNYMDSGHNRLPFALYVCDDNRSPKLVRLIAACEPFSLWVGIHWFRRNDETHVAIK